MAETGKGFRLQASGYRLQASGFRLQATGHRLQATGYQLSAIGPRPISVHLRPSAVRLPSPLWGLLVPLALLLGGCGGTPVEPVRARRAGIEESFREPAKTRLVQTYPITMPVAGRIGRIDLKPGTPVKKGQELVTVDRIPFEQAVAEAAGMVAEFQAELNVHDDSEFEKMGIIEADAVVKASDEVLKSADAQVQAEKARAERAAKELERMRNLVQRKAASQDKLDDAELAHVTALIELRKQEFTRAALHAIVVAVNLAPRLANHMLVRKKLQRPTITHKLAQATARLARARHELELASIRSPIDGVVLARYELGDRTLQAGVKLLELGNLDDMEVVADVLTQDALRLQPGSPVTLGPATRLEPIPGQVLRIEPAGFTKLSSLGVEQQRVRVVVSLAGRPAGLGVGYRLQARFVTGAKPDALVVPRASVLQAPDQSFYVLRIAGGVLERTPVEIGLRSDLELEVTDGLSATDPIVARPDATLTDGMRVSVIARTGDGMEGG